MNEEVGRILGMLEDGKISAEEAERLIRALCETASHRASAGKRGPCGEPKQGADILKCICRALKAAARRQRRMSWWQYYWANRRWAEARSKRAADMGTAERVERLLIECGLGDPGETPPTARLDQDLHFDNLARQVLRYALEDEFGLSVSPEDVLAMATVADVVAFVEARLTPPVAEPNPEQAAEPNA